MAPLELCSSANALFASSLQPSDRPDPAQVRAAITAALGALGDSGCLARLAQQYGDHPEIAVSRMRWARATVATAVRPEPGRESRPARSGVHEDYLPPADISLGSVGVCT